MLRSPAGQGRGRPWGWNGGRQSSMGQHGQKGMESPLRPAGAVAQQLDSMTATSATLTVREGAGVQLLLQAVFRSRSGQHPMASGPAGGGGGGSGRGPQTAAAALQSHSIAIGLPSLLALCSCAPGRGFDAAPISALRVLALRAPLQRSATLPDCGRTLVEAWSFPHAVAMGRVAAQRAIGGRHRCLRVLGGCYTAQIRQTPSSEVPVLAKTWPLLCALPALSPAPRPFPSSASSAPARLLCAPRRWRRRARLPAALCSTSPPASPRRQSTSSSRSPGAPPTQPCLPHVCGRLPPLSPPACLCSGVAQQGVQAGTAGWVRLDVEWGLLRSRSSIIVQSPPCCLLLAVLACRWPEGIPPAMGGHFMPSGAAGEQQTGLATIYTIKPACCARGKPACCARGGVRCCRPLPRTPCPAHSPASLHRSPSSRTIPPCSTAVPVQGPRHRHPPPDVHLPRWRQRCGGADLRL